jgi:aspartate dehydrogenase
VHEISVRSACTDFTIRLEGRAAPGNPRTSLSAGFSVARVVLNSMASTII